MAGDGSEPWIPFWKQATQSERVATNKRLILLFASGSNDSNAPRREEVISLCEYSIPVELCQFCNSARTRPIGARMSPKSPATGFHFSSNDGMAKWSNG